MFSQLTNNTFTFSKEHINMCSLSKYNFINIPEDILEDIY